jgi:membrane-associated phospholipid phosphatase
MPDDQGIDVTSSDDPNLKRYPRMALVAAALLSILLTGCGTLENGRGWGEDAIYPLDIRRIGRAAHNAFFDLETLIPAAGALVFALDGVDESVSDWATNHNPVFGSEESARDVSDILRATLLVEAIGTAMATPSGDEPKRWTSSKLKGLGVELAAIGVTHGVTAMFKEASGRTRPDDSDDNSFPSAHSSGAFSGATLSNRNLDVIPLANHVRVPLQVANLCLASGVAWARVEGRKHYPSHVLAGAALGHFLTAFIHDAFLNLPEEHGFRFVIWPRRGGAIASLSFSF